MSRSMVERELINFLVKHPETQRLRYDRVAANLLIKTLFRSLVELEDSNLPLLFPKGPPAFDLRKRWKLQEGQELEAGTEYSASARGSACGHIFKSGEPSYGCRTCTNDDTCVLCARCFEESDHEGHSVYVSISPGNSGCCDCGDDEAWVRPMICGIHSHIAGAPESGSPEKVASDLPPNIRQSIQGTISQVLDYVCDVFSCAPEHVRASATEESVRDDEKKSRLTSRFSKKAKSTAITEDDIDTDPHREWALAVWHDEKHTVPDVQNQIARACKLSLKVAKKYTLAIAELGRYVVSYSNDLPEILARARVIEAIGLTVTVRSSRDIFREEMCGTIIEWLHDIVGCTVGNDGNVLRDVICEELLAGWRQGSQAHNLVVGRGGIDDNTHLVNRRRAAVFDVGRLGPDRVMDAEDLVPATGNADPEDEDDYDDDYGSDSDFDDYDYPDADTVMDGSTDESERALRLQDQRGHNDGRHFRGPFPIPKTPHPIKRETSTIPAPYYWIRKPNASAWEDAPACETTRERLRLDYLILFDLRMWKALRINVREILISTVVTVPAFKRQLGLRFAGLYSVLAQLYLIADREPDLSIVNLSLQMLTSPSITAEMVERKNFLSNLLAILYTFMTNRQVGSPHDVDPLAVLPLDQGTVTNRRMYHFFLDLRYLLASSKIHSLIRANHVYLMQFIDLVKLAQGIYPAVRALDEHVEYETDVWITAFTVTREINKSCRLFCDAYASTAPEDLASILTAIRVCAKFAIINSIGLERERFSNCETKRMVEFVTFPPFEFESQFSSDMRVVKFDLNSEHLSFHHPLHYMLSWVIEKGKHLSIQDLRKALQFSSEDLNNPKMEHLPPVPEFTPEEYLLAMFDVPNRVLTWIAQMRAGMWVRNGITLRQQMASYCSAPQRELAYNRDVFLLQVAFCVCDPAVVLASIIERFGISLWVTGSYKSPDERGEDKALEIVEDFVHLLIIILSDRMLLLPPDYCPDTATLLLRRDIAHALCFKPLSYSEISARVPEKFHDTSKFEEALKDVAVFKAPETVMEHGTYELKREMLEEIDPYVAQYNKNQREEAETLYREYKSKKSGVPMEQIVMQPQLTEITSGPFVGISSFIHTPVFAEMIHHLLVYVKDHLIHSPALVSSKIEWLFSFVLHLLLIAVREDTSVEDTTDKSPDPPFCSWMFAPRATGGSYPSTLSILFLLQDGGEFKSCEPKIRMLLTRLNEKWPKMYASCRRELNLPEENNTHEEPEDPSIKDETERKKRLAKERQAHIMAQFKQRQNAFMEANDWDDDEDDLDGIDDDQMDVDSEKNWKYPEDNCIMCQERTGPDKLFGTFAFFGASTNFRHTDNSDPKWLGEVRDAPISLDQSERKKKPFGVSAQNRIMTEKTTTDGSKIQQERQGLSSGFPTSTHTQLEHVVTGCGHIMHYSCFANYVSATRQRHFTQIARLQPERTYLNEFTCPLCKALGNTFLPIIWKDKRIVDVTEFKPRMSIVSFLDSLEDLEGSQPQPTEDSSMLHGYVSKMSEYVGSDLSPWSVVILPGPPFSAGGDSESQSVTEGSMLSSNIVDNYHALERSFKNLFVAHAPPNYAYTPLFASYPGPNTDMEFIHFLMCALGSTLASVEISQRGVASDTKSTFLENVPTQTINTLRILSETVMSVAAMRKGVYSCLKNKQAQMMKEVGGTPATGEPLMDVYHPRVVLAQDPFYILTQASFFLVKIKGMDLHGFVRTLYTAEVIRSILSALTVLRTRPIAEANTFASLKKAPPNEAADRAVYEVAMVACNRFRDTFPESSLEEIIREALPFIRTMISTYSLAFLRKSVLLLNVIHGVEFPRNTTLDPNSPELSRLESVLGIPPIEKLFDGGGTSPVSPHWERLVGLWADRLVSVSGRLRPLSCVRQSHPAIYELVGLPYIYDTLIEETMKRKCPTTGRRLSDPVICLFCGDIFCSQATCCTKESQGGCSLHLAKCGKSVGIFLNIRKCMVVMLHNKHGSWFTAPYLDKHSESDPTLRRQQQLFLNQHRYDVLLRNVWLNQGIPSTIARRLESEVNTGGWETL